MKMRIHSTLRQYPKTNVRINPARALPRTRPPLERMKRIYETLLAGRYPNSSTLALELEVSPQTTKRDLEFMRDRWNLPIAYDAIRHGYYLVQQAGPSPVPAQTFALLLLR